MSPPHVQVLGVRHHGPGSARAVIAALDELQPDAVLIEGPADADPLLAFAAADGGLEPPVALFAYQSDNPARSAFWPFAVFSPEWQAIAWAQRHGVPVSFCDLPAQTTLARGDDSEPAPADETDAGGDAWAPQTRPAAGPGDLADRERTDPIAVLARAAGHDDPEAWWEDAVETSPGGASIFALITEAMTHLREMRDAAGAAASGAPGPAGMATSASAPTDDLVERRREAYMRQSIRTAQRSGAQTIAVVCGAWHAPALTGTLPSAASDAQLLRGMGKVKVSLTWVPWTHSRLAADSGYGAGIEAPGWYHHVFITPTHTIVSWLTQVARVLRDADLPVSSAHVIEAVLLANALAAMRGRPQPGLAELNQATQAVMCDGDPRQLALVTRHLVVGQTMGTVPDDVPAVALEVDIAGACRRLRLKRAALVRTVHLDLRKDGDLERSRLLHRLGLLGIAWGSAAASTQRNLGTFRESWSLEWQPELAIAVVEASMWGTTVEGACVAHLTHVAQTAEDLLVLTGAVESALLADICEVIEPLVVGIVNRAALDPDIGHLMLALPALVRTVRYGDVRQSDIGSLRTVVHALLVRVCVGLPQASSGIDENAADTLVRSIDSVHAAMALLDDPAATQRWAETLEKVVDAPVTAPLIMGRGARLLRDMHRSDSEETARRMAWALSGGWDNQLKAAWVTGFLGTSGDLLIHDMDLLRLLDAWLSQLSGETFIDVLPLLRRSFGRFDAPVRRTLGERVGSGITTSLSPRGVPSDWQVDPPAAERALQTVTALLGLGAGR